MQGQVRRPQYVALWPGMSDLQSSGYEKAYRPSFVGATLVDHQPLEVLFRLKILCRVTVCWVKKKQSMSERDKEGKPET